MKNVGWSIFVILFLCGGVYWVFFIDKTDYTKPWSKWVAIEKVCEVGVSDNRNCYYLSVSELDGNIFNITFPNGGYINGHSECFEASAYESFKRFCEFYPSDPTKHKGVYDIEPVEKEWQR